MGSAGAVALEEEVAVDDYLATWMRGTPRLPVVVHGATAVLPVQDGSTTRLDEGDAEFCRLARGRMVEVDHPQAGEDTRTNPDTVDTGARVGRISDAI